MSNISNYISETETTCMFQRCFTTKDSRIANKAMLSPPRLCLSRSSRWIFFGRKWNGAKNCWSANDWCRVQEVFKLLMLSGTVENLLACFQDCPSVRVCDYDYDRCFQNSCVNDVHLVNSVALHNAQLNRLPVKSYIFFMIPTVHT